MIARTHISTLVYPSDAFLKDLDETLLTAETHFSSWEWF